MDTSLDELSRRSYGGRDEGLGRRSPRLPDLHRGWTHERCARGSRRAISTDSGGEAPIEEQAMLFRQSIAYAGRYTLSAGAVIHHVEVSADPTWIGKDQKRFTRFEGKRLIITTPSIATPVAPNPRVLS